ncbi:unnamed protein product, partial [Tetraodon nigroviridis]
IKDTIITDCRKSEVWKIMILDPFTTKLLSSCCKMSDLMAEKITIVEDLFKSREPVPEMKAIYFMSPTAKCVDSFIADFKTNPKYKAAYVYFTDYCPDDLFNNMKLYCSKYIRVCKEININFMPLEAQGKTQAQLLILERGFDPVSPLLHELTYQAMVYDLIDIQNDTYKYKSKDGSEKQAVLNEEDMLWVRLRHKHIAEVSEQIPKMVKEISASKKQPDGKITIRNLAEMMKKMPSIRKQLTEKTAHLQLAEDCMQCFSNNVEKLCKAEQDLAVGSDVEGLKVKDPMRTLLPVLLYPYSTQDKIRAVLLYIFSLGGSPQQHTLFNS